MILGKTGVMFDEKVFHGETVRKIDSYTYLGVISTDKLTCR